MPGSDLDGAEIGLAIGGQFVTRRQFALALDRLQAQRADSFLALFRIFAVGRTRAAAAAELGISDVTVGKRIADGLNFLIDLLWQEHPGRSADGYPPEARIAKANQELRER